MIRHLDLFSGIGGFSLAASWTGVVEPAGFCEIDPWCRRVLAKHWPEVPQHDDIKTLTGDVLRALGRIDLVTGGFPCQPYSVAGNRGGNADDRALWPQMARVIDECRPAYVLGENVPGLINMALDGVSADLEALGYSVRAIVIPAVAVDAPHRRDRLWIVAHANGRRLPSPQQKTCKKWSKSTSGIRTFSTNQDLPSSPFDHINGERYLPSENKVFPRWDTTLDANRWPSEPNILRMVHGLSGRVDRVAGLGNSIVPQVAYEILSVMLADEGAA